MLRAQRSAPTGPIASPSFPSTSSSVSGLNRLCRPWRARSSTSSTSSCSRKLISDRRSSWQNRSATTTSTTRRRFTRQPSDNSVSRCSQRGPFETIGRSFSRGWSRVDDARKIAVAATVWPHGQPVGVVNTHLQSGLTPVKTGDQLQAITGCIYTASCHHAGAPMLDELPYYVLAGDLNTRTSASLRVADEVLGWSGLRRVPNIGRTYRYFPFGFDHIYASRDLEVLTSRVFTGLGDTGSDHFPIYGVFGFGDRSRDPWVGFDTQSPWSASTTPLTVELARSLRGRDRRRRARDRPQRQPLQRHHVPARGPVRRTRP